MKQCWKEAALGFAVSLGVAAHPTVALAIGDYSSWYTVVSAAQQNKTGDVQALLTDHRDPDDTDEQGRPSLIWAVTYDNLAMAKMLLDHGAHVDLRDNFGNTALHWAAQRGSIAMMKLLIADKATVDIQNRQGETPLIQAVSNNKIEAARLLLANGADPKRQDYTGRDALGWAAGKPALLQLLGGKPQG